MGYEYDIFLSYSRKTCVADWIRDRFLPLLRDYVANDLGYLPRVFIDRDEIAPGDVWPSRLKNALATSKCIVAMWSPLYFTSEWCCRELAVMNKRNIELGRGTLTNPGGIILPVNVRDGDSFPQPARNYQWLDCKRFVRTGNCFCNSPLYLEFEEMLQDWTPRVAEVIASVESWREEWLTPDWLEVSWNEFHMQPVTFQSPKMA